MEVPKEALKVLFKEAKDYAKEEVQEGKGVIGTITPEDLQTAIQNAKKEARAEMRMKLEALNPGLAAACARSLFRLFRLFIINGGAEGI